MSYGWVGQLIRVNLTDESVCTEPLDLHGAELYAGGRGLAEKYYLDGAAPKADPLEPANRLIFLTGPLTGTLGTCVGSCELVTKAPMTGSLGACSLNGRFGPELKFAGYDGIVLEGRAKAPRYLFIDDGRIELRDASSFWGKEAPEAVDLLREATDGEAKVACIGPAGENCVTFAVILNDEYRTAGRAGFGAVMGSKNVKAIVVRGTKSVKAAKPKEFVESCLKARSVMRAQHAAGDYPPHEAETFRFPNDGEGLEQEMGWTFGLGCGMGSAEAASEADSLCERLGMDPVALSAALARAMNLYGKGRITPKDTGLDLSYGNDAAIVALTKMTGYRDGFGDTLAQGQGRMAAAFGEPELPKPARAEKTPPQNEAAADALEECEALAALLDSAGICLFTGCAIGLPEIAALFRTCTGLDVSDEELLRIGERICALEREAAAEA